MEVGKLHGDLILLRPILARIMKSCLRGDCGVEHCVRERVASQGVVGKGSPVKDDVYIHMQDWTVRRNLQEARH